MSTRRSSKRRATESSNSHRKVLNVDLNVAATSRRNSSILQASQGPRNEPIDVEAIEDEVTLLSSLKGFPQARNQSKRNPPVLIVLDKESVVHSGSSGGAADQPITKLALNTNRKSEKIPSKRKIINCEAYESFGSDQRVKKKNVVNNPEPQKVAVEEPPTFNCAVCWGPLVEETSTICGHIFCEKCIQAAIRAQKKCPTCRKALTMKNTHRIYLPTSN